MLRDGTVITTCNMCFAGCGILVHLRDGKATLIEGNPDAPLNKGAICPKATAALEHLYHPDRLKHPLRRTGQRGEGKWQQISWDEALGTVADEMNKARDTYGVESVVFLRGVAKGLQDGVLTRLVNVFGSPNITSMAPVCFWPRVNAGYITHGSYLASDLDYPPACFVVWGVNPEATCLPMHRAIVEAMKRGAKLIVVDPRETNLTKRASIWLRPRPGSDLALALAMINVIINEDLYDKNFVDNWTVGFDELKTHAQNYSPEWAEEVTWVPADAIRKAARLLALNGPAVIEGGNALEQNTNSFQCHRALYELQAITGNIGVPGGAIQWEDPPVLSRGSQEFALHDKIAAEMRAKRFGAEYNMAPFARYAVLQSILDSLIDETTPRAHVAFIQGGNLLLSQCNAQEACKAFGKLDFIAISDLFMTPTAEVSDVVLPAAGFLEYDAVNQTAMFPHIVQVQQKVAEVGEGWSDVKILNELAKKLGLGEYFWDSEDELLDVILKPTGLTFAEFRQIGVLTGTKQYRHYETSGFATPSGKVELYSRDLEEWGFDPLPTYHEPPETPYTNPELAKEYPLIVTSWKPGAFTHSNYRQVAALRGIEPEPIVNINPQTANELRIRDGDWVYIETKRGRIRQKARLTDSLDPRVIVIQHGWWYPEQEASDLPSWAEFNTNILTDSKAHSREIGTPNLRGFLCRVSK